MSSIALCGVVISVLEIVISCESSPSSNMFFRCLPIAGKPTQWLCHSFLGTPYRFIFYDYLHFAAVCRHIVQEELYFSIHTYYFFCLKPYVWPQYKGSEFYGLNCYPMCFRWDIFTSSVRYLRFPVDIRLVIPVISVHSGVDFRCVFESKYLIFSIDLENFT